MEFTRDDVLRRNAELLACRSDTHRERRIARVPQVRLQFAVHGRDVVPVSPAVKRIELDHALAHACKQPVAAGRVARQQVAAQPKAAVSPAVADGLVLPGIRAEIDDQRLARLALIARPAVLHEVLRPLLIVPVASQPRAALALRHSLLRAQPAAHRFPLPGAVDDQDVLSVPGKQRKAVVPAVRKVLEQRVILQRVRRPVRCDVHEHLFRRIARSLLRQRGHRHQAEPRAQDRRPQSSHGPILLTHPAPS